MADGDDVSDVSQLHDAGPALSFTAALCLNLLADSVTRTEKGDPWALPHGNSGSAAWPIGEVVTAGSAAQTVDGWTEVGGPFVVR